MESSQNRKNRNRLRMGGLGVLAFGVWGIVKSVFIIVDSQAELLGNVSSKEEKYIIVGMIVIMIMLSAYVRIAIWHGATVEGKGRTIKHGNYYLGLTVCEIIISLISLIADVQSFTQNVVSSVGLIVVELTNLYIFYEVIDSASKLRKQKKAEVME